MQRFVELATPVLAHFGYTLAERHPMEAVWETAPLSEDRITAHAAIVDHPSLAGERARWPVRATH